MSNEEYYKDNDQEDTEEFAGFSIVNEQGVEIEQLKKLLGDALENDDEPTIASEIPTNELTVMLDNASLLLPDQGEKLELKFSKDGEAYSGSVFFGENKIGDFKAAFIKRLFDTRKGQYYNALFHSDSPAMVKLVFSIEEQEGWKKL